MHFYHFHMTCGFFYIFYVIFQVFHANFVRKIDKSIVLTAQEKQLKKILTEAVVFTTTTKIVANFSL